MFQDNFEIEITEGATFLISQIIYCSLLVIRFLYDLDQTIEEKIETIAKEIYGADGVDISPAAQVQIDRYKAQVSAFFEIENYSELNSILLFFSGLQQIAYLHGQNPSVLLPRSVVERSSYRIHRSYP